MENLNRLSIKNYIFILYKNFFIKKMIFLITIYYLLFFKSCLISNNGFQNLYLLYDRFSFDTWETVQHPSPKGFSLRILKKKQKQKIVYFCLDDNLKIGEKFARKGIILCGFSIQSTYSRSSQAPRPTRTASQEWSWSTPPSRWYASCKDKREKERRAKRKEGERRETR